MLPLDRRKFLRSLSRTALVLPFADILALAAPNRQTAPQKKNTVQERSYDAKPAPPPPGPKSPIEGTPLGVSFVDVVKGSGLDVKTIYGGVGKNKYLLETTGCGLAFYDYDNDGWLDRLPGKRMATRRLRQRQEPHCHLFKNNRDGTFTDVTKGSGLEHQHRLGTGLLRRRLRQRRQRRSLRHLLRPECALSQQRQRNLHRCYRTAGLIQPGPKTRWNTGCTWVDYDRDGHLDLFVANYVDFDLKTAPLPEDGPAPTKESSSLAGLPASRAEKTFSTTTTETAPSPT